MKKARKQHTLDEVIRSLSRKNDIRINGTTVQILVGPKRKNDLGNGSWGKIDYLTNHCNFTLIKVHSF